MLLIRMVIENMLWSIKILSAYMLVFVFIGTLIAITWR